MGTTINIRYKHSAIHFTRYGKGAATLFAFHGFSETGTSFLPLVPILGKRYTIYAFDLPFHGGTKWLEKQPFTKSDLEAIILQFCKEHHIVHFSLLGFSMGGKCALHLTQVMPEKIDALWLLASDGIKTNKIYNVAVYPKWGRELFRTTINHPGWFFAVVNTATSLKLLTPWLKKFTYNHMDTREKRMRLYNTWISMAAFNPDIQLVKQKINTYQIPVRLFFGKRDEVIPVSVGAYFAEGLDNCELIQLERGHYFIDEKINPFLDAVLSELPENKQTTI
ncbi:MAG: alpha/beta hydrolase [Bacteroidetes bacterium]|nr:alpha/beta hydrolase [Bacteroidota bacterium]